jgi:hypothetical protein
MDNEIPRADALNNGENKEHPVKENRKFENTNIFISRSRDRLDLVLELDKIKYKILGLDFELFMKDITNVLVLNTMNLEDGKVVLKESNLAFNISHSGKIFVLNYKNEVYTVPVESVERVLNGEIAGKSLTKLTSE